MKYSLMISALKSRIIFNAAGTSAETIGNVIIKVDKVLVEVKPDALLVLGDTNSCLSVIPASVGRYQHFIWRLEIVVLTNVFQKKLIDI